MDNTIHYLNTDLEMIGNCDLTELANAFELSGAVSNGITHGEDGRCYVMFETGEQHAEPEPNISHFLDMIESLAEPLRSIWMSCSRREFNIGYDCGGKPWGFNQALSTGLLRRIANAGASIRITLYPDCPDHDNAISDGSP